MATVATLKHVRSLTDGSPLVSKCEAIQALIDARHFEKDAIDAVAVYASSTAPLFFGVTLGDLASAYLDIAGYSQYQGDNETILSMLQELR